MSTPRIAKAGKDASAAGPADSGRSGRVPEMSSVTAVPVIAAAIPSADILLMLAVARLFTAVVSYSVGTPGGIFAPILSLATCIGLAFGLFAEAALPGLFSAIGVTPVSFGIVAMAALFAATVHAPAVGVVLVLELTSAYALALPMLTACLAANLVAHWLGGRPIYGQMLERTLAKAGMKAAERPDIGLAASRKGALR